MTEFLQQHPIIAAMMAGFCLTMIITINSCNSSKNK